MRLSLLALATLAALAAAGSPPSLAQDRGLLILVGTYTGPKSQGIYALRFDPATGALAPARLAAETRNPSFLALHPNGRYVYAVNEVGDYEGGKSGSVSAFALDAAAGTLTHLNTRSARGGAPCHLTVNRTGTHVLVANYTGGNVAVLPIGADGRLGEASAVVQHTGSSVTERQRGPHAHSVNLDAAGRVAVVADLGIDQLRLYRFDAKAGTLEPGDPPFVAAEPGAGPRHFAFHPDGARAYAINELTSTITAYAYDAARGTLEPRQTISTLPDGFAGRNTTAEVRVHPTGRFVYGSNRGHDSIAVFTADGPAGRLTPVEHVSTRGRTPRNFEIDPSGGWLIAANQQSDSLAVFRIDRESGRLTPVGETTAVGAPVCVRFVGGGR